MVSWQNGNWVTGEALTEQDAGLLGDGLHPDDQGMELMARNLVPHLAPLVEGPR